MLSQRRYRGIQNPNRLKERILQGDFGSAAFEDILSTDRFARYLAWAGGDRRQALELYRLNVAASEALYTPLHVLEVALRNRIHGVLAEALGVHWFDTSGLLMLPNQHRQLGDAKAGLLELRRPISSGRIVAALSFGFWVAMLSPTYETLGQKTLNRIARREDGKGLDRKTFTRWLTPIRVLRNNTVIFEGELESLRRFKEVVEEVRNGTECGIAVKAYNDVKPGDQIECFERIEVPRTL